MAQQDNKEPTQYNVGLSAYEIGILEAAIRSLTNTMISHGAKKELEDLYDKLETQFQNQVTCKLYPLLGNEEAL